jgi:hypothetical protein
MKSSSIAIVLISMILSTACGTGKKTDKKVAPAINLNQQVVDKDIFGDWVHALLKDTLGGTYEAPSGKTVSIEMVPMFRFEPGKFSSLIVCKVKVDDVEKEIIAKAEAEVTYFNNNFAVAKVVSDLKAENVNGEIIACGDVDVAAGVYTFESYGEHLYLKTPDGDNFLLNRK